jgi:hypothetical protein
MIRKNDRDLVDWLRQNQESTFRVRVNEWGRISSKSLTPPKPLRKLTQKALILSERKHKIDLQQWGTFSQAQ